MITITEGIKLSRKRLLIEIIDRIPITMFNNIIKQIEKDIIKQKKGKLNETNGRV